MAQVTRRVVDWGKRCARAESSGSLQIRHILAGVIADDEARSVLIGAWLDGREPGVPPDLQRLVEQGRGVGDSGEKLPLDDGFKAVFQPAYQKAGGMPPLRLLLPGLLAADDPLVQRFRAANPGLRPEGSEAPPRPVSWLGRLTEEVSALQNVLSRKVIGQRRAVQQIADAVFQARVYGREQEHMPRAVLLFLGPPGVGKTYSAQLIAENLYGESEGSLLRLDMSGYADPDSYRMLVGFEPSYQGARPGLLTQHVKEHPESVVLVDEVEKAHPVVHNLFLQVLDRGQLEDKHQRENVSFGKTTLIFTTNLGKDLYTGRRLPGSLAAPVDSREVLEALRTSTNVLTGRPALTPELCSRLAKGYPILFEHLTPLDLEKIAGLALSELAAEFESRLGTRLVIADDRLITLMVLRLGPDLDARTVTSGVPLTIKDAFRNVLNEEREELFGDEQHFERVRTMTFDLPVGAEREFFDRMEEGGRRVLLITAGELERAAADRYPAFAWRTAPTGAAAVEALRREAADVVLLDLRLGQEEGLAEGVAAMRELRRVRAAFPDLPVYLYAEKDPSSRRDPAFVDRLAASGGARGFLEGPLEAWPTGDDSPLEQLRLALLREAVLREMFRTRQTVDFDWDAKLAVDDKDGTLTLRPRDLRLRTVVASKDRTARLSFTGIPGECLDDVAGAREAKRRLREVIGWMRAPETLRALGLDVPAGILLEGPPGNGKTLLARATAGEANLPFFAVAATDFASKWVGESEENIRELFERAATYAPSIVFIDEIDAIGSRRSEHSHGVHDSMLNQLLVSMDGFTSHERPVFFLAATNRADLLDPALKRPGRFDLVISIGDMDVEARSELLRLKSSRLPLGADVDLDEIARAAIGLSGAQLGQVVKEAAILALREAGSGAVAGDIDIDQRHLREALTNVRYGLRREGPAPPPQEIRRTAYHEAGHALLGHLERPGSVHQATVLPRGRALGFVESLPDNEYASITAAEIGARMRMALAGRAAELLIFGVDGVSAGCSQDLEVTTRLAALAVTRYGMSPELGPVSFPVLESLLPGSSAAERAQREITEMVRREEVAVSRLLEQHRTALDQLAQLLVEYETVDGRRIAAIVDSSQVQERE